MPKTPIKILLIEDNPADALLMKVSLGSDPLADFQVTVVDQLAQARAELERGSFDVLLLDLGLPDSQGLETFDSLHANFPNIPVIVLSGMTDEFLALQAVQSGAQDYLVKGEAGWNLAPRVIRYAIERHQSQLAVRASEAHLSTIFHFSPVPTAITRLSDNRIIEVNEAWAQSTGYSCAEVVGRAIDELNLWVHPEERRKIASMVRRDGMVREFEFQMRRKSGQLANILLSAELLELAGEPCMLSMALDVTERKQAENELHKSLCNLEKAEKISHLGHYEIDMQTGQANWSEEVFWIFGINPAFGEPTVQEYNQLVHPEDVAALNKMFAKSASQGTPFDLVYRILRNDGQICYVHSQAEMAKDEHGQLTKMFGTFQDITEQKQTEEALRASEDKYRYMFSHNPQPMWIYDIETLAFLEVNEAAIFHYGFTREEFLSMTIKDIRPKEDVDAFLMKNVGLKQRIYNPAGEWRHLKKNNEIIYVEIVSHSITFDNRKARYVMVNDITERKQTETALVESQRRLATLMASLPGMAFRCRNDHKWTMDFVSEGCYPLTGYHPSALINNVGVAYGQIIHSEDREMVWNIIQKKLEKKQPYQLNYRIMTASGEERWVWEQGQGVYGTDGNLLALEGFIADITERKLAEENIHQQVKELELLYESGLAFSQLLNPKDIARKTIELLVEKLNWHHTVIRLVNEQDKSLELVAFDQRGLEDKIKESAVKAHLSKLITRFDEGLSGWALQQSKIVRRGDVGSDPHYVASYPGIHSGLYVPLKSGERIIGVISIESEKPNAFSEADEQLIATLANQAAIAFENSRLYEEINRYTEELEQHVQERTAEIEATQQRLELAVQTAGIGIWEVDIKKNVKYWDDKLFSLYGLSSQTSLPESETWYKALHPDDLKLQMKLMDDALNNNQPYTSEFRVVWPDASTHYIKSTGIIIHDATGAPERMIGANQDITVHKQAEKALSFANAEMVRGLRMKNEFLANMSHELRTPLNAILGISESLEEQISGTLNEKQLGYIRTIIESGRHLLDLINDILDLSKIEAGKFELNVQSISVEKLCTASLRMIKEMAQKKSLNVLFRIDEDVKFISGDERRLKQSLVNLLGNAVKFTPQGKKIGLEVKGDTLTNEVTFTVWDEGIGIEQENVQHLFKPFVQLNAGLAREYAGTGLGLALVAQMVRLHDGHIGLTSKLNVGSRFIITLPWLPKEQGIQPQAQSQVSETNPTAKIKLTGKILIVDDTEVVAQLMSDYLKHKGYQTFVAYNGWEGVMLARQERPQLILMDVMMPVMNGMEATKQIRADAALRDIPIIGLTALAMSSDREQCLAAGMNDHLSKPIEMQELVKTIEHYLTQSR